ncbi:MAG: hypothetical protein NT015_00220 [Alphaproteobacteria bacterium]|nr:hypothetical protein [Alphaproteobacteria bacterium]
MLRLIYVIAAAALLSACATLPPITTGLSANARYASFDSEAPIEPPVFNRSVADSFSAISTLDRRSFTPPLRRQPDLRVITVTVVDRLRRRALRRVRRRT